MYLDCDRKYCWIGLLWTIIIVIAVESASEDAREHGSHQTVILWHRWIFECYRSYSQYTRSTENEAGDVEHIFINRKG